MISILKMTFIRWIGRYMRATSADFMNMNEDEMREDGIIYIIFFFHINAY